MSLNRFTTDFIFLAFGKWVNAIVKSPALRLVLDAEGPERLLPGKSSDHHSALKFASSQSVKVVRLNFLLKTSYSL